MRKLVSIFIPVAAIVFLIVLSGRATRIRMTPQIAAAATSPTPSGREVILLDEGWRFALGHATDPAKDYGFGSGASYAKATSWRGAAQARFNDSGWRLIDLPHDWAVELPFVREPANGTLLDHGFKPLGRAFPDTSIGWYRKRFSVPKEDEGRRFQIDFDGAFRDCHVWLNGILIGRNEGGYSPFGFDVTDFINYGGENVLAVRVDATQAEGWFYEGAGIYRHVWLAKTAPVHIPRWGTYVTTQVQEKIALIQLETEISNASGREANIALQSVILDPAGRPVAEVVRSENTIAAWQTATIKQSVSLSNASLWSLENPVVYEVRSDVFQEGTAIDEYETRFGIRTIRFDKDLGFFLNGKRVEIQGVCCHQDHAGVGSALPDRLQYFRIARLKEMGVNAYRTSHNAPAPEILDACDELGMLVMDEQRLFNSNHMALDELRRMVKRDRNHPSIILWSIGNEEGEQGTPRGRRIAESMAREVKTLDTTRPVTYASNSGAFEGINQVMDVRGFNYYMNEIDRYHREHPDQPLYGSEIASTLSTRGEYANDKEQGYVSSYDANKPRWGVLAREWMEFYAARPWLAGAFVWTGFDYRGEPTPYEWPCISSHFGILDTCGFPKDLFWYYKSWWTSEPVLHLLPHWNWKGREGQPIEVWAFTNMDEVRLTLNGRDLGTRKVQALGHAEWKVPYEPGKLVASGFKNGKRVIQTLVETTNDPARLTLAADRQAIDADGRDVSLITVGAVDDKGRPVPVAANDVVFDIEGPGRIIGVGNGDPSSHEADIFLPTKSNDASEIRPRWQRKLFNGLAQVIVQSRPEAGTITLKASSEGLKPASQTIISAPRKTGT
jgi:beta-galactosidase